MMTLSQLLLPAQDELVDRITDALADEGVAIKSGGVGKLPMLGWKMMPGAIAGQLAGLLDIGLDDILVGGWNKSFAIRQQLQKSLKTPGKDNFLQLAEHKIKSTHAPYVALIKDGREVGRLPFSVAVELVLQGAVLRIRDGAIREVQTGQIKGKGSVQCAGATLIEKDLQTIKVPGTITIDAKKSTLKLSA
jgi:hypothetical protein